MKIFARILPQVISMIQVTIMTLAMKTSQIWNNNKHPTILIVPIQILQASIIITKNNYRCKLIKVQVLVNIVVLITIIVNTKLTLERKIIFRVFQTKINNLQLFHRTVINNNRHNNS